MHNNFYFLRQLSGQLYAKLEGAVISACFSQSKDELIIRFETTGTPFFIKASLLANFSCLSFPENFQRARKNSVDLFELLIGQRLVAVRQFENERSFALQFHNEITLLFKLHGNRANLILFQHDNAIELFKKNLQADADLKLATLDRSIDWSYENFIGHLHNPKAVYFCFGKVVWEYLEADGFESMSPPQKWDAIQAMEKKLNNPAYVITELHDTLVLSLIPFGEIIKKHTNPLHAVNDFYHSYTQDFAFSKEKYAALTALKSKLENYTSYLDKTSKKLTEVQNDTNYKVWADVIMANLHAIPPHTERTTLLNFYNNNLPVEIKLKKDQSPQKNAEVFYRKSKNQRIEVQRLQEAIDAKEKEITTVRQKIESLENARDLKSIRSLRTSLGLDHEKEKQPELLPYHAFEFNGYKIWVGRNAQSNDTLTLKYSFKEDLWLHAKDVAGSHVIIKHQAGKNFPKDVIERAAQLAAYNSKRKNESLCPVVVTPKKFVRKRKGDPAGTVVVEREEVILVEPKK
jgi:predicted ribosome quality control (RQC) complex YloA/Tae2 family protein